jgi:hypothetical protein
MSLSGACSIMAISTASTNAGHHELFENVARVRRAALSVNDSAGASSFRRPETNPLTRSATLPGPDR